MLRQNNVGLVNNLQALRTGRVLSTHQILTAPWILATAVGAQYKHRKELRDLRLGLSPRRCFRAFRYPALSGYS